MSEKMYRHSANPVIAWQRSRIASYLGIKRGEGDHLTYVGYYIPEGDPLVDVFLHTNDNWEYLKIGLPEYLMVDISGTYIRYATPDEIEYFMSHKLERRKPCDGEREYL